MIRHLSTLILASALTACVSVSLPSGAGKKSDNVRFNPPPAPFRALLAPSADQAWVSENTGNTISFLSDCEAKVDPPLAQLQAEALDVLDDRTTVEEKTVPFNGREALITTVVGDLDGVKVMMTVLTSKKNACNYTLMYTGVDTKFKAEKQTFMNFLDGFKAP